MKFLIFCFFINCFYCEENNCTNCKFPDNPNIQLKDIDRLKPLCGKRFVFTDPHFHEDNDYVYHIGICVTGIGGIISNLPEAAIQMSKNKPTKHVIGRYNNTELTVAGQVLILEYHDGDQYGSHCNSTARNTIIVLICDPDEDEGKLLFVDEKNYMSKDCQYVFTLSHKSICVVEALSLSAGAIILLIVFPVIFVYLLLGALYKKCFRNATGWELLPNFNFWKEFGALQADGCNFICRCGNTYNDAEYDERLLT